ncbi:hypothetical protein GCM10010172_07580 [Paractinoplanes ferrugineus]|uniref:Uncharacterized protein n=1 Tax=Paractinoplanes ferrugineus TaxID=113564 RepID=A0A919MEG8_9ACTN|nr:hypothetical protein [Actinoplanes ferrugineus]GIE16861.1 hypothetical protein Afe05nite_87010 [Actinoplanes ferrugineus]
MTASRVHEPCGQPMRASSFGKSAPTPAHRLQPIWACDPCASWEPAEGWQGPLPDGWDGERWKS